MAIKALINKYLEATEAKFGAEARSKTVVKYRGGMNFFIKRHIDKHAHVVDMGNLQLMTRHLQASI
ncbi:hypothetical protein FE236_04980 [Mariprofundus erugo]|uniref:Uncharacterized protein n=1 Tax=Mariprofundus erugo TaxID=2528639 RepID=A0A5R9GTT7_9PROT|nr:hypothetical protein [Mariprofundus erugo]TLS68289.1 hypothetical protein FEF65_04665 [Mariprofundus erugo]TLS77170.1 hypothetical protein FE236_04980 [Mariprofundus erugo]